MSYCNCMRISTSRLGAECSFDPYGHVRRQARTSVDDGAQGLTPNAENTRSCGHRKAQRSQNLFRDQFAGMNRILHHPVATPQCGVHKVNIDGIFAIKAKERRANSRLPSRSRNRRSSHLSMDAAAIPARHPYADGLIDTFSCARVCGAILAPKGPVRPGCLVSLNSRLTPLWRKLRIIAYCSLTRDTRHLTTRSITSARRRGRWRRRRCG